MCGIAGYLGNFSPTLIKEMAQSIKHRGPDGDGIFMDKENKVALAHTRLSIIDLSDAGHQPMIISGYISISFNGEIYNYINLRDKLKAKGYSFKSTSDTEVLAYAYIEYGLDCFALLNGIFSLAIWDMRLKKLIVVRDGLGVKPLYYATTKNGFLFSSELKAILCEQSISRTIDPVAAAQYLTYLWTPAEKTMLKSVHKAEPGTIMEIFLDGSINTTSFYHLPPGIPDQSMTEQDAIDSVREAVKIAVERQMVADVDVGAFLSGGLDSSSIVAFANQFSDQKLQCFTMNFAQDSGSNNEMTNDLPYARKVAKVLNVDLHEVSINHTIINRLPEMIYHLDEPQADPAILNTLLICELAKKNNIKVLLSGAGGDDIFTGYRRHYALSMEKYWAWAPKVVRAGLKNCASLLPTNKTLPRKIRKIFDNADLSHNQRIESYYHWLQPQMSMNLLADGLRNEMTVDDITRPLLNSLSGLPSQTPPINKMLNLDAKYFLTDHNLNYTDKMGMATGVEIRVPLLDKDLVALAARLPINVKQRGTVGKWVFKKAMEGILPHDTIYRPKTGFGVPLRHWLEGDFGQFIFDELSSHSIQKRGIFNTKAVKKLLQDTFSGNVDGAYSLLSILCQELWCQQFLDTNHIDKSSKSKKETIQ